MYLENGWKPPEQPSAKPPMSKRDEGILLWLIVAAVLAMMLAPIGGATIVQAFSTL